MACPMERCKGTAAKREAIEGRGTAGPGARKFLVLGNMEEDRGKTGIL